MIVSVPLSPAMSVVLTMFTACVLTAVTKPLAFTVTTGIALPLPKLPTLLLTVANVTAPLLATVMSPLKSLYANSTSVPTVILACPNESVSVPSLYVTSLANCESSSALLICVS